MARAGRNRTATSVYSDSCVARWGTGGRDYEESERLRERSLWLGEDLEVTAQTTLQLFSPTPLPLSVFRAVGQVIMNSRPRPVAKMQMPHKLGGR